MRATESQIYKNTILKAHLTLSGFEHPPFAFTVWLRAAYNSADCAASENSSDIQLNESGNYKKTEEEKICKRSKH
jgi:hypothetical protein